MKIIVNRSNKLDKCIIGEMFIDDVFFAYTLEDIEQPNKVYGETCIPLGNYSVIVDHSNRFNRDMPHILNVPGFEGIRIHGGNTDKDTHGCILIGSNCWLSLHKIGNCAERVSKIIELIKNSEDVMITIRA